MQKTFVHLQLHTEYSLCDGLIQIPLLMNKLAALNQPAVAITDQGNLYAAIKFYTEALRNGIKPILGIDLILTNHDKDYPSFPLTLLCQNQIGYANLLKLVTRSYLEGQTSGKPIIDAAWLTGQTDGLIALSGGKDSDIGHALLAKQPDKAKQYAKFWQTLFPERFYLSVCRLGLADESAYIQAIVPFAEASSLPLVAVNAVRFLEKEDFEAHEARVCVQEGYTLNDPARPRRHTEEQYLRSSEVMVELFKDIPEAISNTLEIAKRCNLTFELGINRLPHFIAPDQETSESYLSNVAKRGLEERLQFLFNHNEEEIAKQRYQYDARLQRELDVINQMGFAGYFLIVADFTKWSKENGVPVGPGRGSGPGSLVAYALYITGLDPIALELLFERFLNPERVSMPDFDIDFCIQGRDRVIEYVMEKHGRESVSQIITYGTMAAKAVIRDVGRVLAQSYGFVDKIAKLIPFEIGMTLEKALQQEPMLSDRYENEEDVKTLIDLALKLEGLARNVGKHAGGIVIAPGKLTDFVPLYCEANEPNHPLTQFDKDDVEAVGLVKFDFLGLKTLTIIDKSLQIINRACAENNMALVDINTIPLDDVKTFALLKACRSSAVFQLESHGMRDLIKRLQPDCFEDIIALVALFRPGPLQSGMVDDFIDRKHGKAQVIYPHPSLEPILRPTYGVIVYQEQVMQIAQVLAGYTLGAADILRRAMGKKKPEEMAKQRQIFCDGAVVKQIDANLANQIFDLMEKFAGYGFNKSHSASYALIAYQTAWLKATHTAAFMSAVLTADMDKTEKILGLLEECQVLKLHVSPPDINQSFYHFHVVSETHILYGLGAIKGIGEAVIENIVEARSKDGGFIDLFDFCRRIDLRKINRRALEAFIRSGCFDSLGMHRAALMANLNQALQQAEQYAQDKLRGQQDLLAVECELPKHEFVHAEVWDSATQLLGEKETLGFYLTGHPLNAYMKELSGLITCRLSDLHTAKFRSVKIAGIISEVKTRLTKRGDKMAILRIDDGTAQLEAVCFSDTYYQYQTNLVVDQIVIIDGEVTIDDFTQSARLLAREVYSLSDAREKFAKNIVLTMNANSIDADKFSVLLNGYLGGQCNLTIRVADEEVDSVIRFGNKWKITPHENLLNRITESLAPDEVLVRY